MKYVFVFLGSITLLIIILLGIMLGYGSYLRNSLTPSAIAYADESVRAIITTRSKDELIKRSSPEFRSATTQGQLDQFFANLNQLGQFQSYSGVQVQGGGVDVGINTKRGLIITAHYAATATFQNGRADIKIKLIRHDNAWQIEVFYADRAFYNSMFREPPTP